MGGAGVDSDDHRGPRAGPGISVVVVCRNERDRIGACLRALLAQGVETPFEVLAVDGDSTDGTQKEVEQLAASDSRLRLVRNPDRLIAPGRNRGIEAAQLDLVAFTDADCEAPQDWLRGLLEGYRNLKRSDPALVAVGGGNRVPPRASGFARAVGIARTNFWGNHGSVQGRRLAAPAYVDHLPTVNVLYEKTALVSAGGFDESLGNIGEDLDLSLRLAAAGKRFAYLPGCEVEHLLVSGPSGWIRKMAIYGRGRVWVLRKHGLGSVQARFLFPALFVLYLAVGIPAGFVWPGLWLPAALYLVATAAATLQAAHSEGMLRLAPLVYLAYLLTHLSYGVGELVGLVQPKEKWRWGAR